MMMIRRFIEFIKRLKRNKLVWIPATILYWLMPAFYLFEMESFHTYPMKFLDEFLQNKFPIVVFDLILLYTLFLIGYFLVKKAWINLVFFSAFLTAVSLTNYIKFALRGENFLPHDFIMAGNMNELVSYVSVSFPWWAWALMLFALFATVILSVFAKDAPFKFYIRIPVSVILSVAVVLFFTNGPEAGKIFNKIGMYYESTDNQDTNYRANGFVGAFSINIAAFSIQKPEGYSTAKLEAALSKYQESPPSNDYRNPDIIVVLSESFWDPRLLPDSEITPDPFENFDRLSQSENALSGRLIIPTIGGGTIRTEFEILTGLSVDALPSGVVPYNIIKKDVPSYVSYYKNLGYDAIAIHPYIAKFYNRNRCLPRIGFDEYYAESLGEIEEIEPIYKGGYISDETFVEYLEYFLNESEKSENPLFLFGITMENHQKYSWKYDWSNFTVKAKNPHLNESDHHNFENYTQGVQNADQSLGQICEFVDKRERPTVLVFFGDHLPMICSNYTAYLDTGFVEDTWTRASRDKLYSTPYIIYSNFELNTNTGNYETVSSYNLLNVLSTLIGSGKTKYMGYLDALREELPHYNVRMAIPLTDGQKELLQTQYYATYKAMTN